MNKYLAMLLLLGLSVSSGLAQGDTPTLPALADLKDTWTQIDPGGDTICSKGTPYHFFVHPGTSNNLLINFDGGGGCWNDATCGPRQDSLFTEAVELTADTLSGYGGIFDFDNPENPFADYSMVFVPYCTADMHMGDSLMTYGEGDQTVETQHNGFVNAGAALAWTYANFEAPERVFITGVSAGSPGAIFHAPFIMEHYADIPVTELGDSGGGWRVPEGALAPLFTSWGTINLLPAWVDGLKDVTADTLTFETLYTAAAAEYPDNTFAQYNTAQDRTQNIFLSLMSIMASYNSALPASLDEISAAPNFRSFTAGGITHGILGAQGFYTYAVDGLRVRDWVAALENGDQPDSVQCSVCYKTEEVSP